MPLTAEPSFASRTSPTKLASAPTSRRPRVSDSSARPMSKSSFCTRTVGTLPSGHGRKERHFIARLEGRGEVGHLLVHGHAPGLAGREGLGPARVARTQLIHQR